MPNQNSTAAKKEVTKFKEIGILRPTERYPNGQPFTAVPRFFFRLWQLHSDTVQWPRGLPSSFWITLFFILDVTIGNSPEGREGRIAQSQFPVEEKDAANWIAALSSYKNGCLIEVDYAEWVNTKGSTFRLNPSATEDDWTNFIFLLRVAWLEGRISRNQGNTPETIRELFATKTSPPPPEIWMRLLPIYEQPPEDEREKIWNDWIRRGFGVRAWYKHLEERAPFGDEAIGVEAVLVDFLMLAWLNGKPQDEKPLLPDNPAWLKEWYSQNHGNAANPLRDELFAAVLSRFQKVASPEGWEWKHGALEYPWLTEQWRLAKANVEWEKKAAAIDAALAEESSSG